MWYSLIQLRAPEGSRIHVVLPRLLVKAEWEAKRAQKSFESPKDGRRGLS